MYEVEQVAVFGNPFGDFDAPNFPTCVYVKKADAMGTVVLENFRRAAEHATALAAFEFARIQHVVGNAGNGFAWNGRGRFGIAIQIEKILCLSCFPWALVAVGGLLGTKAHAQGIEHIGTAGI